MKRSGTMLAGVLLVVGLLGCVLPEEPSAPTPAPTAEPVGPLLKPALLYPESHRLIDRVGRVVDLKTDLGVGRENRSVFVPQTGEGYFVLLENAALGELEEYTRHGEKLVKVSGTVTVYDGRNYFLLTRWARREY